MSKDKSNVIPIRPVEEDMDEDYTTTPLMCLVGWLLFVAFCAWCDGGFPIVGPL